MGRVGIMAALALSSFTACAGARPVPVSAPSPSATRRETIKAVLPHNVRVVVVVGGSPVRSASGVAIGKTWTPDGALTHVLTNAHVIAPRQGEDPRFLVLVDLPTGDVQEFVAKIVAQGTVPELDLAVLSVAGIALEPAIIASDDEVSVGDDVVIVGAPYGRALSVSGGMISQLDRDKERRPSMLKTDAAIGYGASGGGLFAVESGKLLGIVEGYRTAQVSIPVAQETFSFDVPMPGETFAAPAAKIRRFLKGKGLGHLAAGTGERRAEVERR